MDPSLKRDARLINVAGVLGTVYFRIAFGEILLFFITQCLMIPKETWALVAALLPITSAAHLVSAYLTERLRRRKVLSLACFSVARLATPAIALLPFITGEKDIAFRLYYLAAALIAHNTISALGATSWLSWIADIVPEEQRGRFWSVRLQLSTLVNIAALLTGGWLVDYFTPANRWGYLVTFGYAFIIGQLDLIIHAYVPDRPMVHVEAAPRLRTLLAAPWRHVAFRNLMLYRTIFVFGGSIVGPFAFMYLIEELRLSAARVCLLTAVFLAFNAVSFPLWRRVGERLGYRTVCMMAGTMSGFGILYWWFLQQDNFLLHFALLILARVYFGVADAGIMLAHTTLTMNIAPEEHRSMYFAQVSVIISVAMGLGILLGRWLFIICDPPGGEMFFGTRLTGVHILIGLFGLSRFLAIRVFYRRIPDAQAEAAMPRVNRILRTNALRIFPALLTLERPLSPEKRAEYVQSIKDLVPSSETVDLHAALQSVLRDTIQQEDEFHTMLTRARSARWRGVGPIVDEIAESAALHISPARARAASRRIKRLFAEQQLGTCLRAVQRLAHQTADAWASPMADAALPVIDALAEAAARGEPPRHEATLLALYAYLQIVREPDQRDRQAGASPPGPPDPISE